MADAASVWVPGDYVNCPPTCAINTGSGVTNISASCAIVGDFIELTVPMTFGVYRAHIEVYLNGVLQFN